MPYAITGLHDQENGSAPLRWGHNAVADGLFSQAEGLVWIDSVQATVVSWSYTQIVFTPVQATRPDGFYTVHVDNHIEPLYDLTVQQIEQQSEVSQGIATRSQDFDPLQIAAQAQIQQSEFMYGHDLESNQVSQQSQVQQSESAMAHGTLSEHIQQGNEVTQSTVSATAHPVADHISQQSAVTQGAAGVEHNLPSEHIEQQSAVTQGSVGATVHLDVDNIQQQSEVQQSVAAVEHNLTSEHISEQSEVQQSASAMEHDLTAQHVSTTGEIVESTVDLPFFFVTQPEDLQLEPTWEGTVPEFTTHPQPLTISKTFGGTVPEFTTHPTPLTISKTDPSPDEYLHDFTLKDIGAWTHTRASDATAPNESGTIITYTTNQPAWYWDQGLQLEDHSTNYVTYTTDWDSWTIRGAVTATNIIGPDNGADSGINLVVDTTGGGTNDYRKNGADYYTPDALCAVSVYMRKVSSGTLLIMSPFSSANGLWTVDLSLLSGGWERVTDTHPAVTVTNPFQARSDGYLGLNFRGEGTQVVEVDLALPQLEDNTVVVSSFIHVPVTTPITRAATNCTATFAELGAPLPAAGFTNDFCFQFKFVLPTDFASLPTSKFLYAITDSVSGVASFVRAFPTSTNRLTIEVRLNNAWVADVNLDGLSGLLAGQVLDCRGKVSSTEGVKFWANAIVKSNGTVTGGTTTAFTAATIGSHWGGANGTYLRVIKARIRPEALTDEEIEAWT